jgi:hypothetical protein
LQDGSNAQRLKGREQGFSISLSQVRSAETNALFRRSILPAIYGSPDPSVLRECFILMHKWSISATMKQPEKEDLASRLVGEMLQTADAERLDALVFGLDPLKDRINLQRRAIWLSNSRREWAWNGIRTAWRPCYRVERSRSRLRNEGGIPSDEVRRRLGLI